MYDNLGRNINKLRVSLTEAPEKEIPVAYSQSHKNKYFKKNDIFSSLSHVFAHKILRKRGK